MFARSLLAGLAFGLLSTSAMAANMTDAGPREPTTIHPAPRAEQLNDRCAALLSEFDQDIGSHAAAAKANTAKVLRTRAETLCKANNATLGLKDITQALTDIGIKASL